MVTPSGTNWVRHDTTFVNVRRSQSGTPLLACRIDQQKNYSLVWYIHLIHIFRNKHNTWVIPTSLIGLTRKTNLFTVKFHRFKYFRVIRFYLGGHPFRYKPSSAWHISSERATKLVLHATVGLTDSSASELQLCLITSYNLYIQKQAQHMGNPYVIDGANP